MKSLSIQVLVIRSRSVGNYRYILKSRRQIYYYVEYNASRRGIRRVAENV